MAQQVNLAAASRSQTGTGAARALRRSGQVPAVIYGHGREPEPLAIDAGALSRLLPSMTGSTILDVTVDGRAPIKALLRDIQRHALRSSTIVHLDLYEIHADEEVDVRVAVHLNGIPDGVRNFGGVLDFVHRDIEIRVLPGDIPASIDVDVTNLAIGHSIFVRDLVLAKGEILDDPNVPVCTVVAPRTEEVAAPVAEVASTEPELIRKPKAEDGDDDKE
ncbi:MAG TPA: 50S ribosomal protein L25 [Gemmatimonadales bacterium]|nr:50S ribosomal protein L25 [Gemmatimonadales bacterium]HRZ08394.1 50S ribosomal protein L25 [Gemmatimonadales bacterium]